MDQLGQGLCRLGFSALQGKNTGEEKSVFAATPDLDSLSTHQPPTDRLTLDPGKKLPEKKLKYVVDTGSAKSRINFRGKIRTQYALTWSHNLAQLMAQHEQI